MHKLAPTVRRYTKLIIVLSRNIRDYLLNPQLMCNSLSIQPAKASMKSFIHNKKIGLVDWSTKQKKIFLVDWSIGRPIDQSTKIDQTLPALEIGNTPILSITALLSVCEKIYSLLFRFIFQSRLFLNYCYFITKQHFILNAMFSIILFIELTHYTNSLLRLKCSLKETVK